MTTLPVRVERRVGQRFSYLLPLSLRQCELSFEGVGFTQDLSSRGVFFFTDAPLQEGSEIEITLQMPSEITLGESMRVRCRGHVLRVVKPVASVQDSSGSVRAETKIGVAMRLEGYDYLPDASEAASTFPRVSVLHQHGHDAPRGARLDSHLDLDEDRPLAHASARPVLG
jgi:PilZ domain-containing protein